MKKAVKIVLTCIMCLSLIGCASGNDNDDEKTTDKTNQEALNKKYETTVQKIKDANFIGEIDHNLNCAYIYEGENKDNASRYIYIGFLTNEVANTKMHTSNISFYSNKLVTTNRIDLYDPLNDYNNGKKNPSFHSDAIDEDGNAVFPSFEAMLKEIDLTADEFLEFTEQLFLNNMVE